MTPEPTLPAGCPPDLAAAVARDLGGAPPADLAHARVAYVVREMGQPAHGGRRAYAPYPMPPAPVPQTPEEARAMRRGNPDAWRARCAVVLRREQAVVENTAILAEIEEAWADALALRPHDEHRERIEAFTRAAWPAGTMAEWQERRRAHAAGRCAARACVWHGWERVAGAAAHLVEPEARAPIEATRRAPRICGDCRAHDHRACCDGSETRWCECVCGPVPPVDGERAAAGEGREA